MKLLVSGEGPSDIGACNNAQGVCMDDAFSPGPMTIWLTRLWEAMLDYNLLNTPEAVVYVTETALAQKTKESGTRMQRQRGKKQGAETGLYFSNAQQLGLIAQQLAGDNADTVMAVWKSINDGFKAAGFDFGVPMLPKPKSEAWLLCATKQGKHSHAALESISGNDDSPNSAKKQWDAFMGHPQTAAQEASWCAENPADWENMLTMPSFKAFYDRFHVVANAILKPRSSCRGRQ